MALATWEEHVWAASTGAGEVHSIQDTSGTTNVGATGSATARAQTVEALASDGDYFEFRVATNGSELIIGLTPLDDCPPWTITPSGGGTPYDIFAYPGVFNRQGEGRHWGVYFGLDETASTANDNAWYEDGYVQPSGAAFTYQAALIGTYTNDTVWRFERLTGGTIVLKKDGVTVRTYQRTAAQTDDFDTTKFNPPMNTGAMPSATANTPLRLVFHAGTINGLNQQPTLADVTFSGASGGGGGGPVPEPADCTTPVIGGGRAARPAAPRGVFFRHNWGAGPVIERFSWLTPLAQSKWLNEQRPSVRSRPRRQIEYSAQVTNANEGRHLRQMAQVAHHTEVIIPFRPHRTPLTADLALNAIVINCDTTLKDFEIGSYALVVDLTDPERRDFMKITAKTSTSVTVQAPGTSRAYSAALTRVEPARACYFTPDSLSHSFNDNRYDAYPLTFDTVVEDEAKVPSRITVWSPGVLYDPNYTIESDFAIDEVFAAGVPYSLGGLADQHSQFIEEQWWWGRHDYGREGGRNADQRSLYAFDNESGVFSRGTFAPGPQHVFDRHLNLKTAAEISKFIGWLYHLRGPRKKFWLPTEQEDFEFHGFASPMQLRLRLPNTYAGTYNFAPGRQHIAIYGLTPTGQRIVSLARLHSIASTDAAGVETFNLSAAIASHGQGPTAAQAPLFKVSFLQYCRLDTDTVEVAYDTDSTGGSSLRLRDSLWIAGDEQ